MKHTIYKWFWAWSFETEEKWLNEMSAKGMQLVSVGLCKYTFEESTPSEYIYRLELLENVPSHPASMSYIHFLEETGVQHIGSVLRWVYLRKKATEGEFNLFSDIDSKIKHYKRLYTLLFAAMFLNLPIGISNLSIALSDDNVRPFSIFASSLNLFIGLVVLIVAIVWGIKINKLKKEKVIRE